MSYWSELNNTVNISLCELYKHKYHGISSHIWCYFISINNCDAKAFKRILSEVQIFCDLINAAVFFHVSRKEQIKGIHFCQMASFSAGKGQIRQGIFLLFTDQGKRQAEFGSIRCFFFFFGKFCKDLT